MHFYQDDRQGQYNNYSGYDDREQRFPETYTPLPPNSPQPPLSHATPRQNNAPAKADAPPKELKTMSNTAVRCVKVALSFLALGGCAGAILSGVAIANKIDHPDVAGYGICQSLVLLASVYSFGYVALHIKAAGMGRYLYDAGSRSYFMHRIHAWASFSLFLTVVTWTAAIAGLITIVGMNQRSDAQSTLLILDLTACTLGFLPSIVLSCILCGIKRPFYLGNVTVLGEVGEAIKRSKKEGKRVGTENKTNDKRTKDEVWERSDTTSTLSGSTLSGRTCGDNNSLGGSTRSCRTGIDEYPSGRVSELFPLTRIR
ncbi:hypothetical protein B0T19DRAFT_183855 [Cercophora scortea]|uniref:Uncharacterized protein n=1 Tax=Cercophora scortea TaxID=314031 RepID=A0AAE0MEI5_9PEZI|nr:hypothetical protein B0T19DRAFT_183855 [Cercophora scortea]